MTGELLFQRFADQLRREISTGKYPVGCILPSISKMQENSGLSRNTILSALRILTEEGIISRVGAARYGYTVVKKSEPPEPNSIRTGADAIALVFPFSYNNYIGSQLLQTIEATLSGSSRKLFIRNHENSSEREFEILNDFLTKDTGAIGGIILMTSDSYRNPNRQLIKSLSDRVPMVLLDRYIFGLNTSFIGLNNRQAGRDAALIFIENGHRNLGFISGFEKLSPMMDRLEGFREATKRHSLEIKETNIIQKTDEIIILDKTDDFADELRTSLDLSENGPTAYFCGDDKSAMILYRTLEEQGVKVPEQVSIIGCNDDGFVHAASDFAISSFRHPFAAIAEEAVRILENERTDGLRPRINIEISAEFIDRNTVARLS